MGMCSDATETGKQGEGQTRYKLGSLSSPRKRQQEGEVSWNLSEGLNLVVKVPWYMHRDLLFLSAPLAHLFGRNGIS